MSFSFNFVVDDDGADISLNPENVQFSDTINGNQHDDNNNNNSKQPAHQHLLSHEHIQKLNHTVLPKAKIDSLSFPNYANKIQKVTLNVNDVLSASQCEFVDELKSTDLISGVYEGGFKLWECSIDVINYLISSGRQLKGNKVLECGCGHGLPGLYAIVEGATVDFQDYNPEVIEYLTMPNVLLTKSTDAVQNSKFFSGDWQLLSDLIPAQTYDLIVTSDTLYHTSSHKKLYNFLKHCLKPNGEVLVAAKRYYFGCGGSVHDFKQMVQRDGQMTAVTVAEYTDGQSNVREIISLRFI